MIVEAASVDWAYIELPYTEREQESVDTVDNDVVEEWPEKTRLGRRRLPNPNCIRFVSS